MQPIIKYLIAQPEDPIRLDKHLAKKASRFVLLGFDLYKRGYSLPLLKCISKKQVEYVMNEINYDICSFHSRHQTMSTRILKTGYYWPILRTNYADFVKRYKSC